MPHKDNTGRCEWRRKRMQDPVYAARILARQRAYRRKNLARIRQLEQDSYARRRPAKLLQCATWRKKNVAKQRVYALRRRNKDKLNHNTRTLVWRCLKGKKNKEHWEDLVGFTAVALRAHLEKLFLPGMTWDNYGRRGWHVDHIRPMASFKITSTTCRAFKACWALTNLRPYWAIDNMQKGAKWPKE